MRTDKGGIMDQSTWVDFKSVKQAVSMERLLDYYGIKLRRRGEELRGRCPIHQGQSTDTLHVNLQKNAFHCFSCGAKGNVLDFAAAMERCSIRDAGVKLQAWFGVTVAAEGERLSTRPSSKKAELAAVEETGEKIG